MKIKIFTTAIIALSLFGIQSCKNKTAKQLPQAVQLPVYNVATQNIPNTFNFTGSVIGYRTVNVDARSDGYLKAALCREGTFVRKGDLLYIIDPTPYSQQELAAIDAVKSARANLTQATQNYNRIRPLAEINAASQSDLDNATATLATAKANLATAQSTLAAAAQQMGYTRITAPISGVIGINQVDEGAFVGSGAQQLTLNTISQIDSIKVIFYVPEKIYLQLISSPSGKISAIELTTATGELYPHRGRFAFYGRQISAGSGSIQGEAVFPNPNGHMRPGAFAQLNIVTDTIYNMCVVPQSAINQIQNQKFVYRLNPDSSVVQIPISIGSEVDTLFTVTDGLKDGDRIVTAGFHKIHPGVKVIPSNTKK